MTGPNQLNSLLPQGFAANTATCQQEGKKYIIINQPAMKQQTALKTVQPLVFQNMNFNQANQVPQFVPQNNLAGQSL